MERLTIHKGKLGAKMREEWQVRKQRNILINGQVQQEKFYFEINQNLEREKPHQKVSSSVAIKNKNWNE